MKEEAAILEVENIFDAVLMKITYDSDFTWVPFENASELREHIHMTVNGIKSRFINSLLDAELLFLVTGALQEHCLSNGWSDEYIKLADRFDKMHAYLSKSWEKLK